MARGQALSVRDAQGRVAAEQQLVAHEFEHPQALAHAPRIHGTPARAHFARRAGRGGKGRGEALLHVGPGRGRVKVQRRQGQQLSLGQGVGPAVNLGGFEAAKIGCEARHVMLLTPVQKVLEPAHVLAERIEVLDSLLQQVALKGHVEPAVEASEGERRLAGRGVVLQHGERAAQAREVGAAQGPAGAPVHGVALLVQPLLVVVGQARWGQRGRGGQGG